MPDPDQPRTPAPRRCNDPYPHPYTTTAGYDEKRLCELEAGHTGPDHRWGSHAWRDLPNIPAPARIETEVLSGAEMQALISAGRVILREAPAGDPLGPVLASAVRKLMDAVGISDD